MSKLIDLTGQKFGRLTVIKRVEKQNKTRSAYWLCQCECGNTTIVSSPNLKNKHAMSCDCLQQESRLTHSITHGLTKTRIYKIYLGMKKRCYNKNYFQFQYYGGKGIRICDEWLNNFKSFYDWSIANNYNDTLTIDRINSNGNYCPENCRWVDKYVQANNKKTNKLITYNNETHTMKEWSKITGLTYSTIQHRLDRNWDIEKALTTPQRNH